jgi:hypothetical protein
MTLMCYSYKTSILRGTLVLSVIPQFPRCGKVTDPAEGLRERNCYACDSEIRDGEEVPPTAWLQTGPHSDTQPKVQQPAVTSEEGKGVESLWDHIAQTQMFSHLRPFFCRD